MEPQRLGLIGIGNIGQVVAERLLAGGHHLVGTSKPPPLGFRGTALPSAEAVGQGADIILCCLPHEAAATEVYHAPEGLLAGLRPGHVVLDLATYALPFKQELAARVAAQGALMLDGEVSGTPDMLRANAGTIFLAGDQTTAERLLPLCLQIAAEAYYLGPFGAANRMKLINNLLSAIHTAAAAEAMALGFKAGFEPTLLARVLASGSGSSKYLVSRGPMMARRDFTDHAGAMKIFAKYLDYIPVLADEANCATPMFDAAKTCFEQALAEGHGDEDMAAVYEAIANMKR